MAIRLIAFMFVCYWIVEGEFHGNESTAVYQTDSVFEFICQTEDGYDKKKRVAKMKILKDNKILFDDFESNDLPSNYLEMDNDDDDGYIRVTYSKEADSSDTGLYSCTIDDGKSTASAPKRIIIVKENDDPTFVKAGTQKAVMACLIDPPTSVVCEWSVNGKPVPGENCTHQKLEIKEDVMEDGLNVNCTVEPQVGGASSRNLPLEKRVVAYTCDKVPSDHQPVTFTCKFRGNVIPNVTVYHGGNPTHLVCPETEGLLSCTGELPHIDGSARFVVRWADRELVNISFTEFLTGDGNGPSTKYLAAIIVGGAFAVGIIVCCCCYYCSCCPGHDWCQRHVHLARNGTTGNGNAKAEAGKANQQEEMETFNSGGGAQDGADVSALDETMDGNTTQTKLLKKESENGEA